MWGIERVWGDREDRESGGGGDRERESVCVGGGGGVRTIQ